MQQPHKVSPVTAPHPRDLCHLMFQFSTVKDGGWSVCSKKYPRPRATQCLLLKLSLWASKFRRLIPERVLSGALPCVGWPTPGPISPPLVLPGDGAAARVLAWTPQVSLGLAFSLLPSLLDLSQPDQLCTEKTSRGWGPVWGSKNLFGMTVPLRQVAPSWRLVPLMSFRA